MLTIRYRGATTIPIEAECLTPDRLRPLSVAEVLALPVQHGNVQVPLGEFFDADGDPADGDVRIEGDCARVKLIGAGMTNGRIVVDGSVGMHLGAEMRGGSIEVTGDASDWVGAEMRGGQIRVRGKAGHLVGAGYRGSPVGMRGGVILIHGAAGNEIGSGMRRGCIAVGGECGDFAGTAMIAGSILLFGKPGLRLGAGMKRGTIAVFAGQPVVLPTFRYTCTYRPTFLNLYLGQLRDWGYAVPEGAMRGEYRRYGGDLVSLGKGELLWWSGNPN